MLRRSVDRSAKALVVHLLLAALFSAVLVSSPVSSTFAQQKDVGEKIRSKEKELESLRKQIQDQRKRIGEIEKKAKNINEYISRLKKEEALTKQLIAGLAEKEKMLEDRIDTLSNRLDINEKIYKYRLVSLSKRLREMYKNQQNHPWQELLEAKDFSDLLQKYKFLMLFAEQDASLLEDVKNRKAEIERQQAELTELLQQVYDSKKEKEEELKQLKNTERKRKSSLRRLNKRKALYEKRMTELARSQQKLKKLIERLEKARLEKAKAWLKYGEKDFFALKGRMLRPVEGKEVRGFGKFRHPEFGTITYNTGVDIAARAGSPVRAVARGRIEYASTLPGYGNCIIVNHGGGYYTLYAHIARIFVADGDQVEKGDVIAEAGSASSITQNPFHFEIRKSKKALDPDKWLRR